MTEWRNAGYVAVCTALALIVGLLAAAMGADPRGVWAGVSIGLGVQLFLFGVLSVWLFAGRRALAYGLGMLARFATVGMVALVLVPLLALPAAATLLSLVGVLFVTNAAEPLFSGSMISAASPGDAVTLAPKR